MSASPHRLHSQSISRYNGRHNVFLFLLSLMSSESPAKLIAPAGIELVTTFVACALWGATCVQTFLYFVHHCRNDSSMIKLLVTWVWAADTVHVIVTILGVYKIFVTGFGDASSIDRVTTEFLWALFATTLVSLPTQLFFTFRIWIFSGKKHLFAIVFVPLAIFQPAAYTAYMVLCLTNSSPINEILSIQQLLISVLAVSAAIDVLIAMSLLYLLWAAKTSSVTFQSSRSIVNRLSILTVNTGIWTALCSVFTISTLVAYPSLEIFIALTFIISPLYANTLMANLNGRNYIRGDNCVIQATSEIINLEFAHTRTEHSPWPTDQIPDRRSVSDSAGNDIPFNLRVNLRASPSKISSNTAIDSVRLSREVQPRLLE